ncbi:MAG: radical SAM protein [Nitrospina sp.]|jgi:MoaA/NifB/PqqE/SkfB family radical SAM enzyme|nr:radical SAM protein [Nitrospina sp.]MBT7707372.1 radical SAM protein [Nitrospina sp.]
MRQAWLELETQCNLNCRFCYNYWRPDPTNSPSTLKTEEWLKIIERLAKEYHCSTIALSGGEPLLRNDILEIIQYCKSLFLNVVVTSNGYILDRPLAQEIKSLGVNTVQIPLLSNKREVHDYLSGRICMEQTLRSIISSKAVGLNVAVVVVLTSLNVHDFFNVMKLCYALGIPRIIVNQFVPGGNGILNNRELEISDDYLLEEIIIEADSLAVNLEQQIELGIPINFKQNKSYQLKQTTQGSCSACRTLDSLVIDPSGEIKQCSHWESGLGNILSRSKKEIEQAAQSRFDGIRSHQMNKECEFLPR